MKPLMIILLVVFSLGFTQAQNAWAVKNDSLLYIISRTDVDSIKVNTYVQLKEVWQTKDFRKAVAYGHQALYFAQKSGSQHLISIMYQLAWAYMSIGNAAASIDILQQIIPLTKDEDMDGHGTALSFIAMNYVVLKDYDNALKYMRNAVDLEVIMNAKGKYLGQISYLGSRLNMAIVFVGKNQVDSALKYGKIAYQRLKNEKQIRIESGHFLWNIPLIYGDAHRIAKHKNEAMQLYLEALHYAKKQNNQTGIHSIKLSLAYLFEQIQSPDSSLEYAHQALIGFQQSNDYPKLGDVGLLLHQLYKRKNNAIKALQFYEIGMTARDSVMNREKILQVQYLEDKQERHKRELEIEEEQNQVRQRLYLLLVGIFLFFIIATVLYRNNLQKQRLNEQLIQQKLDIEELYGSLEQKVIERTSQLQNALDDVKSAFGKGQSTERKRVSADLHDEIGSALSTIAIFSDLSKRKAQKTAPEMVNEIEKIGIKSREMIQTMKDTIWSLNDDSPQDIWERLHQYANELFLAKNINLDWQIPVNQQFLEIDFNKKRNVLLAFKEALNNIVKHANAKNVMINCKKNNTNLELSIIDDGKGFEMETLDNQGNGLKNFHDRMKEIGGEAKIESKIGIGTSLTFTFPNA
jgi:signal transduction histidine kinase